MEPNIIAILALIVAVLEFLYQRFVAEARREIKYEHRFTVLEERVKLYWQTVENSIAKQIHSPHLPEVDYLLDKAMDKTITLEERKQLVDVLDRKICEGSLSPQACYAAEAMKAIELARIKDEELIKSVPKVQPS